MKFQNVLSIKCFVCNYPDTLSVKNEKNREKEIIERGRERERGMKREEAAEEGGLSDRVATDDPLKLLHDKS